jgi:peptide/nickel transport system ATP-binding protein
VAYRQGEGWLDAVREVSLTIERGQTYGLVGESGSGKSTLALAVMRYLGEHGRVRSGSIELAGRNLLELGEREMRRVWREQLKLVPQNPLASLNPSQRIGKQLAESLPPGLLRKRTRKKVGDRVLELLSSVGLADPERVAKSYPHQLSGGMQQRVMIAMALASEPMLLVLDEPTTNLDATTEATILDLVRDLAGVQGTAVLYVSHSLGVVAQLCERVAVLYAGELVEDASVTDLYRQPLHPYTYGLLASVPGLGQDRTRTPLRAIAGSLPEQDARPAGCIFAPRCPVATNFTHLERPMLEAPTEARRVRCHRWREIMAGAIDPSQPSNEESLSPSLEVSSEEMVLELRGLRKHYALKRTPVEILRQRPPKKVHALDGLDLTLRRNRTLGLVGESGSGKSTLARCVVGLTEADGGNLRLLGLPLARELSNRDKNVLRHLQMVFQNADEALNPYRTVGDILRRPLVRLSGLSHGEASAKVSTLLRAVKLDPAYAQRLPGQLSGGEKQRVAIARAFATQPDLLVLDESVSGLDVSVQATVLNLLGSLQLEHGSAYLFISHDLAVVSYLADEIAVMYLGQLMEMGRAQDVLTPPYHPYTEALLSAIPSLDPTRQKPRVALHGEVPSPVNVPGGCRFHTRCPRFLGNICRDQEPPWQVDASGKRIYCHIPLSELKREQEPMIEEASEAGA